ncbi:histidine phosphatase family protein [Desulforhopalus sp. IMCC35007]|uniref:histidine phosphatase family protein n=1 Tax=Desulforhopalus sp. IMCC35007 TaxID=2569543 RepID=UPI0010AE2E12|nr:histidine phosphatase family protein [Desulforhopalus sp. IMCC35007]TKB09657.1 histidine phosphatase family protein [Desulforhopalus sp. IMCC35007]
MQQSDTRLILIRHGETEWNRLHRFQGRSDIPLNPRGHKQAQALALALKNESITAMYSSPLRRAAETAFHIGRFHPTIPLIKESGLMEMDLGQFEGMKAQYWKDQYQEFRGAWEKNPATLPMPGGESLEEVQRRAVDTLRKISQSNPSNSTLLICSHNFVIVSLLCFAAKISLDQFREMRQETAALNIMHTNGTDFQIEKINDRSHLNYGIPDPA